MTFDFSKNDKVKVVSTQKVADLFLNVRFINLLIIRRKNIVLNP